MSTNIHAGAELDAQRLPERLRGVILPEISRLSDLVQHTGLPARWFLAELESGRLPGIRLAGEWLVHRRAIEQWVRGHHLDGEGPDRATDVGSSKSRGRQL